MTYRCVPSAFPQHVLAEATQIAPGRRTTSDGICGNAIHRATGGDHVADSRGIPHAVDVSQSTPGSPFWRPGYALFDAHAYGRAIAQRMAAGVEKRVKYLVSFDGHKDVIFNPAVSMSWRQNGAFKTEHANHLHISFWTTAEQSVAPLFAIAPPEEDMPLNAADLAAIRGIVKQELAVQLGGASTVPPTDTIVEVVKHYTAPIAAKVGA